MSTHDLVAPPLGSCGLPDEEMPLPIEDPEITSRPPTPQVGSRRWIGLGVVCLGLVIFFPNLGSFGLWDPWETHYGEVTRNMVETHDWITLKWGYEGRPVGAPPAETGAFLSKPILIFWSEAMAIRTFGYSEWAFRLPMALLAFLVMMGTYHALSRITGNAWMGALSALVVATCPQFYLISRQAQTDMLFVGSISLGMLFLLMALFAGPRPSSDRSFLRQVAGTVIGLVAVVVPQLIVVATDMRVPLPSRPLPLLRRWLLLLWNDGRWHALLFAVGALALIGSILWPIARHYREHGGFAAEFKDCWSRRLYLFLFYACMGLATLAKGLLGFLLPGAIIFFFILVTWNWRLLGRVQLLRGSGIFLVVTLPWYLAMFAVHGMRFYSRFFVHDHFNRFASGVHQVDTGLFEHFMKWLGLGMFPWAALVPMVLLPLFLLRRGVRGGRAQLPLFLFVWCFFAYFLFTRSSTKFHHYIFPALVPLGILVGMWLRDLPHMPVRAIRLAAIVGIGFSLSMGVTLHEDWQGLRNLMTYKYDRPLPEYQPVDPDDRVAKDSDTTWKESRFYAETPAAVRTALGAKWGYLPNVIRFVTAMAILAFFIWLVRPSLWGVRLGTGLLLLSALVLSIWSLNVYLPMLSSSWSQKYIFDEYYARCERLPNDPSIDDAYTPLVEKAGVGFIADWVGARGKVVCNEDIVAWLFTWRGETFYSNNEILPIAKTAHMKDYLLDFNGGKPFYAVLETHRRTSFDNALNRESKALRREKVKPFDTIDRWEVELVHEENAYFVLVYAAPLRVPPDKPPIQRAAGKTMPANPATAPPSSPPQRSPQVLQ